jgi:hypothetical protein
MPFYIRDLSTTDFVIYRCPGTMNTEGRLEDYSVYCLLYYIIAISISHSSNNVFHFGMLVLCAS